MQVSGGPLSCARRNLRQVFRSPVSWGWVGVILGIQTIIAIAGGFESQTVCYENLGLSREGFMSGKIWQVVTHGLLHGGWWHAGLNALFVLLIGSRIEHMAGKSAVSAVMWLGVVGGGLSHLLVGSGLLVGFSGGCFALLLLLTTLSPESRMAPLMISAKSLGIGILLAELFLSLINPVVGVPGLSKIGDLLVDHGMGAWFQMGHACHFGGGIAGWLYGRWVLRPRVSLDRLRRDRARREAG